MSQIETDNPTAEFEFDFGEEVVTITLEFHFSDNAENFFDVEGVVEGMTNGILREIYK